MKQRLTLPVHDWPAEFQRHWLAAFTVGNSRYSDTVGPCAHWSTSYRIRVARGFGRYLAYRRQAGHHDGAVTPEGVEGWIEDLKAYRKTNGDGLAATSIASFIEEVRIAVKSVIAPDQDWAWLDQVVCRLKREARQAPLAKQKQTRLVPLRMLHDLGTQLIADARDLGPASKRAAVRYRDGLMILILCHRAIRLQNLVAMAKGRNLLLDDDRQTARLSFDANDMKGKRAYAADITALYPFIREYLDIYRPQFDTPDFWPSQHGGALTAGAISRRIGDLTLKHLGVRVPPHLFRDCLATTLTETVSAGAQYAQSVLHHRDAETMERYNRHAEGLGAQRQIDDVLSLYEAAGALSSSLRAL